MTMQDLIIKLEECRNNMEQSEDELSQATFDTLNSVIHDIETYGIEGNEYYERFSNETGWKK